MKLNDTSNTMAHHVLAHAYALEINANRLSKGKAWEMLKDLPEPLKARTTDMMKTLIRGNNDKTGVIF